MNILLSGGLIFIFAMVVVVLVRYGNIKCVGRMPTTLFTFIAILFTSGLDVGLIMFPLTEFGGYADDPAYGFTNPLAVEFGFWGFLIWAFYFLTSFYFCIIEPRVKFFEIKIVKIINNIVIIGTCAFTAALFLRYFPWYAGEMGIGDGESGQIGFYIFVAMMILAAAFSSTDIKYVKILSVSSTWLFFGLIVFMFVAGGLTFGGFSSAIGDGLEYFKHIPKFALPLTDYHAFYLFWWFAWSIMIGQFTSRFIGGLRTYQVLLALLIIPSIPLMIWFAVLYNYHLDAIEVGKIKSIAMIFVGVLFVINSLDSLIRLYTDNLNLTTERLGKTKYIMLNWVVLSVLALLFKDDWLQIQWVGALVICIYFACFFYIIATNGKQIWNIRESYDWSKSKE